MVDAEAVERRLRHEVDPDIVWAAIGETGDLVAFAEATERYVRGS